MALAQPANGGGESDEVPVAMAAEDPGNVAVAVAGRLVDVRLHLPDQGDGALSVNRAAGLAGGAGEGVLLAGRQGQRQRVAEVGGDDVEGDRLRTPAEMRVPAVQDHALRHRLVFRDQLLDVDYVHQRAEGNGDPRRPPFQLARTPEARGGTAAHPQPVIALQVADRRTLTDWRRIL